MNNKENIFPKFQKSIEHLIEDEEGNIPGNKLLMLGTMVIILGSILSAEVQAAHRSHSSHSSHSSHQSGASGHSNHGSHVSHDSHQSHGSHSNTAAHSNSNMEGVASSAPAASSVPRISTPESMSADTFNIPNVNQNIEMPNGTPNSGILPSLAVPTSSIGTKIDVEKLHIPSATDKVQ